MKKVIFIVIIVKIDEKDLFFIDITRDNINEQYKSTLNSIHEDNIKKEESND